MVTSRRKAVSTVDHQWQHQSQLCNEIPIRVQRTGLHLQIQMLSKRAKLEDYTLAPALLARLLPVSIRTLRACRLYTFYNQNTWWFWLLSFHVGCRPVEVALVGFLELCHSLHLVELAWGQLAQNPFINRYTPTKRAARLFNSLV